MDETSQILRRPLVALLTDFGTVDPFVGVMKAVMLARCPNATIVDLTHAVPPQRVAEGAFWLERCLLWFPAGTVFVAVVDPGVGTARRPLVVEARSAFFVGPDNGLLSAALAEPDRRVYAIDPFRLGLRTPSNTFHGRDIFAPVAAEIAAGRVEPAGVGPEVFDPVVLPAALVERDDYVEGVVVTIDRFGNLITNIDVEHVTSAPGARVEIAALRLSLHATYGDVAPGDYVALVNAFGTIEVAKRDGDAALSLGIGRGAHVIFRRQPGPGR